MPPFPTKFALAALVAALAVSAAAADRKTVELTATTTTELALGFDPESARRRALKGEYNPSFDPSFDDDEEYEYEDEYEYDSEDYDYYDEYEYDYTGDSDLGDYIASEFPEDELREDIPADAMDDGEDGEGPDVGELDDTPFEEIADLDAELEVLDVIERSGGGGGSF